MNLVDIIEAARRALGGDYPESPVHVAEWVCRAKMAEDENQELREGLSWALDVLDLCIKRLVTLGEPEPVLYRAGRNKALEALRRISEKEPNR
jgi:hypothetical protein